MFWIYLGAAFVAGGAIDRGAVWIRRRRRPAPMPPINPQSIPHLGTVRGSGTFGV